MRDAEGRKKEASKIIIQTKKQSNTAHPRQSLFQTKIVHVIKKAYVRKKEREGGRKDGGGRGGKKEKR